MIGGNIAITVVGIPENFLKITKKKHTHTHKIYSCLKQRNQQRKKKRQFPSLEIWRESRSCQWDLGVASRRLDLLGNNKEDLLSCRSDWAKCLDDLLREDNRFRRRGSGSSKKDRHCSSNLVRRSILVVRHYTSGLSDLRWWCRDLLCEAGMMIWIGLQTSLADMEAANHVYEASSWWSLISWTHESVRKSDIHKEAMRRYDKVQRRPPACKLGGGGSQSTQGRKRGTQKGKRKTPAQNKGYGYFTFYFKFCFNPWQKKQGLVPV